LRDTVLPQPGVACVVENEGEVAVLLVDDAIAPSVEPGDGPQGLAGTEPAMELDAELANGNVLVEELVDDVELEAFDIHFQEVDVRVSISGHDGGQVIALEGYCFEIALRHGVGTFLRICRYGELKDARAGRESDGEEFEIVFLGFCSGLNAGGRWIEDENGLACHLRELHFKGHGFADAGAVGDDGRRIDADDPAAVVVADALYVGRGGAEESFERDACSISGPT